MQHRFITVDALLRHTEKAIGNCLVWTRRKVLTAEKVVEVFHRHRSGFTPKQTAIYFGVRPDTIYAVLRRESWKHVEVSYGG